MTNPGSLPSSYGALGISVLLDCMYAYFTFIRTIGLADLPSPGPHFQTRRYF